MLDMSATNDGTYGASFVGREFQVGNTCYVLFSVTDLDDGIVTFQYCPDGTDNWYSIDATELVTDATDILKFAILGGVRVRAIGDADISGASLFIGIHGNTVTVA